MRVSTRLAESPCCLVASENALSPAMIRMMRAMKQDVPEEKRILEVNATHPLVEKAKGLDLLWYIWKGNNSPVFGKDKMTTFERYFIADKAAHKEPKNPYYTLYENEETVDKIFREFGLEGGEPHIINGHVPVIVKKGESPIKCGGKLLVIDGGFSKAYQEKTGNAGYTLIYNSYGLVLAAHPPFETMEKAVLDEISIDSEIVMKHSLGTRKKVADTDTGTELKARVADLEALLKAYRSGLLTEK